MKTKIIVFMGIFALTVTSASYAQKTYNLKFSYHTPPIASIVKNVFNPYCEDIEKQSKGQIKVTQYAGSSLCTAKDMYDATISGLCDMAFVDPNETPGRFPEMEFDTLPYVFPDAAAGVQIYWDILQKYAANGSLKNVKVLTCTTISASQYAGNIKVRKITDFKGVRLRAAGRTESWIVSQLGATPIEIAFTDLGTSLERGLVDGCFLGWTAVMAFGIKDVTKYLLNCDMFSRTWMIVMNKKVFESMSADLQKGLLDASDIKKHAAYCRENEEQGTLLLEKISAMNRNSGKPGVPVLSKAEKAKWKNALIPVWDKWVAEMEGKKKPGKAIIADIKDLSDKYDK